MSFSYTNFGSDPEVSVSHLRRSRPFLRLSRPFRAGLIPRLRRWRRHQV